MLRQIANPFLRKPPKLQEHFIRLAKRTVLVIVMISEGISDTGILDSDLLFTEEEEQTNSPIDWSEPMPVSIICSKKALLIIFHSNEVSNDEEDSKKFITYLEINFLPKHRKSTTYQHRSGTGPICPLRRPFHLSIQHYDTLLTTYSGHTFSHAGYDGNLLRRGCCCFSSFCFDCDG